MASNMLLYNKLFFIFLILTFLYALGKFALAQLLFRPQKEFYNEFTSPGT